MGGWRRPLSARKPISQLWKPAPVPRLPACLLVPLHPDVRCHPSPYCPVCSEAVEYKYVLLSEQNHNVTWQPGGNLTLRLEDGTQVRGHRRLLQRCSGPIGVLCGTTAVAAALGGELHRCLDCWQSRLMPSHLPTCLQSVLVLDDWLGQTHEVKPADLATPAAVAEEEASAPADVSSASAAVAAVEEAEAPAFVAVDSEDAPGLEVVAPELPAAVAAAAAVAEEPEEQAAASELTAVLADPAEAATELAPAPNAAVAAASEAPAERLAFRILAPTAEESWKDVLAVANESFAQVAEEEAAAAAAAEEAAAEEATAVTEAVAAVEEPTVAEPALPAAAAVEEAPVAVAEPAAAAKAPAAQLNLTNGAPPAPLAAEKAPVLAVAAPVASPKQSGLLRCLALFARLVLVASLIVAAVISFLRSPWAAARFTFLAL